MVSWKEQQKIIEDAQQCLLNPDLSIKKNDKPYAKNQAKAEFDTIVMCPFCLKSYQLGFFPIKKGLRVCPNCNAQLRATTLTEITNLDKFVEFVFNYRFNGFWSKICLEIKPITKDTRFNEWYKRLRDLGLSFEFWEKYKLLKGDYDKNE